jgi:adenylate cyclase
MAKVRALAPDFGLEAFLGTLHFAQEGDTQHVREGLVKAGAEEVASASGVAAQ